MQRRGNCPFLSCPYSPPLPDIPECKNKNKTVRNKSSVTSKTEQDPGKGLELGTQAVATRNEYTPTPVMGEMVKVNTLKPRTLELGLGSSTWTAH